MANKSVLELAVQTGQWDAGLKKAQKALRDFTDASGGLQKAITDDSASMQKFVQMMGRTDSQAKTAKGQLNDYKSTIEQLTMQYNQMNEAQKRSIGQDYLRSIDQLKQKYQDVNQQIQEMNRSLAETPDVKPASGSVGGGLFGGGKLDGMLQVFGGNVMTKIAGMGAGLVTELGDAVKQGIELAKQGEGIRIAFERLGRGDILQGLREATHGTVTDLELMKAAVKFNDFKLPLDELGTMLAFAQQKAKDTGQSVDYMVDSIVTGLGRKSLMILDNLGLSASEVKDRMKETGDMTKAVGAIIREQMAAAGEYVETAADRATKANVEVQNAMTRLGETFQPLSDSATSMWTDIKVGALDLLNNAIRPLIDAFTEAGRLRSAYAGQSGNMRVNRQLEQLKGIQTDNYRRGTYKAQLANYDSKISQYEQYVNDYRTWQKDKTAVGAYDRMQAFKKSTGLEFLPDVQAQLGAFKQMRAEYVAGAKSILTNNKPATPPPPSGNNGGGTTSPVPVKIEGFDINKASLAATRGVDTMPSVFGMADRDAMRAAMGIAPQQWDAKQDISKSWHIGQNGNLTQNPDDKRKEESRGKQDQEMAKLSQAISAIGSIKGGLEQMGIKLPAEAEAMIGGLQGLMSVIQGVSTIISMFSSTTQTANTAAVTANMVATNALTAAMYAVMASSFIPLAHGGVVHAAGGWVGGNQMSGDRVPAMLNSGELVLNRFQQEALAGTLQNNNMQRQAESQPYVTGSMIYLGLKNYLQQNGFGDIVTTKRK